MTGWTSQTFDDVRKAEAVCHLITKQAGSIAVHIDSTGCAAVPSVLTQLTSESASC